MRAKFRSTRWLSSMTVSLLSQFMQLYSNRSIFAFHVHLLCFCTLLIRWTISKEFGHTRQALVHDCPSSHLRKRVFDSPALEWHTKVACANIGRLDRLIASTTGTNTYRCFRARMFRWGSLGGTKAWIHILEQPWYASVISISRKFKSPKHTQHIFVYTTRCHGACFGDWYDHSLL